MKTRLLSIVFALAFVPVLLLVLVVTVQATPTESGTLLTSNAVVVNHGAHHEDSIDSASLVYAPNITFTPVATTYLPLLQRASPVCGAAPILISPANGSQLDSLIPVFTYMRGTAPVSYTDINIADNPAFDAPIEYSTFGGGLGPDQLRLFENLQPATTYYWRVQDVCGSIKSPYSSPLVSFRTGSGGTILTAPTLASPVSGTQGLGRQVTLAWNSVGGAVGYEVYVCTSGCVLYFTSNTSQVAYFLSPNTTYVWHVFPYNSYAYGNASATWQFRTGAFLSMQNAEVAAGLKGMDMLRIPGAQPGRLFTIH